MQCAKYAVRNATCWLEHLGLTEDWDDPEGIKVRAVEGLSSMDYMLPGFFVWAKVRTFSAPAKACIGDRCAFRAPNV